MKECSICQQTLPLEAFAQQSTGRMGRRADCKKCIKRFDRSLSGLVKKMLSNQKAKSKKRGHLPPQYTEQELFDWVWSQPQAKSLYDSWVASNYHTDLIPSIDRLDDYKTYSLDNIQLTTGKENKDRYSADAKAGINTKSATTVHQYDMEGQFIQTFHSFSAAARAVKSSPANIRNAANNITINRPNGGSYTITSAAGYRWRL